MKEKKEEEEEERIDGRPESPSAESPSAWKRECFQHPGMAKKMEQMVELDFTELTISIDVCSEWSKQSFQCWRMKGVPQTCSDWIAGLLI